MVQLAISVELRKLKIRNCLPRLLAQANADTLAIREPMG